MDALPNTSRGTHLCRRRHLAHHKCARALIQLRVARAEAAGLGQKQLEEAPESLLASSAGTGEPQLSHWTSGNPQSSCGGSHSFSNRENSSGPLGVVFPPNKSLCKVILSGGSRPSCSPSSQGWEQRKWAAGPAAGEMRLAEGDGLGPWNGDQEVPSAVFTGRGMRAQACHGSPGVPLLANRKPLPLHTNTRTCTTTTQNKARGLWPAFSSPGFRQNYVLKLLWR